MESHFKASIFLTLWESSRNVLTFFTLNWKKYHSMSKEIFFWFVSIPVHGFLLYWYRASVTWILISKCSVTSSKHLIHISLYRTHKGVTRRNSFLSFGKVIATTSNGFFNCTGTVLLQIFHSYIHVLRR